MFGKYKDRLETVLAHIKGKNKDTIKKEDFDGYFTDLKGIGTDISNDLNNAKKDYETSYQNLINVIKETDFFDDAGILDQILNNNFSEEDITSTIDMMKALVNNDDDINVKKLEEALTSYSAAYNNFFDLMNTSIDVLEETVTTARNEDVFHQLGILGKDQSFMQYFFTNETWSQLRRDRDFMRIQVSYKDGKFSYNLGTRSGLTNEDVLNVLNKRNAQGDLIYDGRIITKEENSAITSYFREINPFMKGTQKLGLGRFNEDYLEQILTHQPGQVNRSFIGNLKSIVTDNLAWWKGGDKNLLLNIFDNSSSGRRINLSMKSLDFLNRNETGYGFTVASFNSVFKTFSKMSQGNWFKNTILKNVQFNKSGHFMSIDSNQLGKISSQVSQGINDGITSVLQVLASYITSRGGTAEIIDIDGQEYNISAEDLYDAGYLS